VCPSNNLRLAIKSLNFAPEDQAPQSKKSALITLILPKISPQSQNIFACKEAEQKEENLQ
jgi:hypothetical protein